MRVVVSCSGKFHAFALVEQLEKNGNDVVFFTSYSSIVNPFVKIFAKRIDKEDIKPNTIQTNVLISLALKIFRKRPQIANNLFDFWVSRRIRKLDADIFIGWSGMSLYSIHLANRKGWKTILERGSTHIEFQNEVLKEEYLKRGMVFSIDQQTINKEIKEYSIADTITIPSSFVERTFLEKGVPKEKLFINHFGASHFFSPREEQIIDQFRVLYLGTFSIRKGAYYLTEAIEKLKNEEIEFWFIGNVDFDVQDLKDDLMKYENVKFFGHVNHYELSGYIEKCSVAIHPSLEEGQSMVINQVMKVGVPFIATPNSGAEELITHNENGIIIPAKSGEAISNSILSLKNSNLKLMNLTKKVRQMQISDNSWEAYGKRYIEFMFNI
jgi:glycosyltransferase involved in cell wall biosynthesis